MPSAPVVRRRSPLRLLAAATVVTAASLAPVALLPGVAVADEPAGTPVVGRLVQAWPEHDHEPATGHVQAAEPLSWIETAAGDAVRVPTEDVEGIPTGSTVSATVGSAVGDAATGEEGVVPARDVLAADVLAAPAEASSAPVASGLTNEVTVVLVRPGGVAADGATPGRVAAAVDGPVADFWSEQTGGALRVGVTAAHGWITTAAGCSDPARLWDEAAAAVGFTPGDGKHLLLHVSRSAPGCSYALAEVGREAATGGRLYVTDTTPSVIAHELGHNFGLGHSSGRQCDAAVDTGTCRTVAYRDLYDVMGVSWAHMGSLNAAQADRLQVLPEEAQHSVSVWGSPATVSLAPLSGRAGARALLLTDAAGVEFWLEYRTAAGRDAWLAGGSDGHGLDSGVLLRQAPGTLPDTSLLLDGTPARAAGWDADLQSALPIGVPVAVSGGQFSVVVQSVSATAAVLTVTPAPPTAAAAPAPTPVEPVPGTVMAGTPGSGPQAAPDAPGPAAPALTAAAIAAAPDLHASAPLPGPSLESVVRTTKGSGLAVPVAAGSLLAGALMLVLRRLRPFGRTR